MLLMPVNKNARAGIRVSEVPLARYRVKCKILSLV